MCQRSSRIGCSQRSIIGRAGACVWGTIGLRRGRVGCPSCCCIELAVIHEQHRTAAAGIERRLITGAIFSTHAHRVVALAAAEAASPLPRNIVEDAHVPIVGARREVVHPVPRVAEAWMSVPQRNHLGGNADRSVSRSVDCCDATGRAVQSRMQHPSMVRCSPSILFTQHASTTDTRAHPA